MKDELICQLAMTLIPNIDARARALVNHFGDARSIFSASLSSFNKWRASILLWLKASSV
jgi:hypothetical protein